MAKFHSFNKAKMLPAKGNPGDHYLAGGVLHVATKSGVIVPIDDFMAQVSIGPKGERGEQGPAGSATLVGPQELKDAVARLRADKARMQAAFVLGLEEAAKVPGGAGSLVKNHILKLKQRAGI